MGARQKAGNSLQDIAALVAHAHTYWARVYVTVNTLLHDDELPQAVRLIHELYDLGVDAVIIQDVGLLESGAPWVLPPIALIASTQMHNHTPERVAFLEEVGFDLDELASLRDLLVSMEDWETVEDSYKVDIILPIDSQEEAFSALLEVPELASWFWESFYSAYNVTDEGDAYVIYLFEQPYSGDATPYGWYAVDKATGAVTRIPDR